MISTSRLLSGSLMLGLFALPVFPDSFPVIIRGKVTMPDGSPPPFSVGIERICSDNGSGPGPITDKKGEYIWRTEVNPMSSRACFSRATHAGYSSTEIDISALLGYTNPNINLEPLVIRARAWEPYTITVPLNKVPGKANAEWKAALKAMDAGDYAEVERQFQAAVTDVPKFAEGWHALGVVLDRRQKLAEARDAYEHSIQADPKFLPAYITLARLCIKMKDWDGALKTTDALIKADKKEDYVEVHLHRAVAQYELKNLDGALASAQEMIRLDLYHQASRAEYVLGRILEAKGDVNGAREHMTKYLELDKNASDANDVRKHIENLGKPAEGAEPALEVL